MEMDEPNKQSSLEDFLSREFTFPAIDLYIERKFEQNGLLPMLEEQGIVPRVVNPNPYNPEGQEEAYDQWWEQHDEEFEAYDRRQSERILALKLVYVGTIIGHLKGKQLLAGRDLPRS